MYPGLKRNPGKGSKRKICRPKGRSSAKGGDNVITELLLYLNYLISYIVYCTYAECTIT